MAAKAAPAVGLAGALAAFPQVRDLASASTVATGHPTAQLLDRAPVGSVFTQDAASSQDENRYSQRAKTAGSRSAVRAEVLAAERRAARAVALRAQRAAQARASAARAASPSPSPAPARAGSGTGGGRHAAPVCSATGGMLPANTQAIVDFLTAHGYTANAAAGIAGNIYQESGGNPESGSSAAGGLIGWTPLPAGYITGNAAADLQTQLAGVLIFNQGWSQYLPALNAAASPAAAADIYVTDFEHAGAPAAGTREASANAVAAACHL